MGSGIPLLNEYKLEFFWKRFPQTVLGGPKLKVGDGVPPYVYLNQLLLFMFPWLLGAPFTALAEYEILGQDKALFIYGSLIVVFVLIVQLISFRIRTKCPVTPLDAFKAGKKNMDEEDEIDFISCCGKETLQFLIPGKKFKINILLHALLSGPLCALGLWYLQPNSLNNIYNNSIATAIVFIFGWITICIAEYSLSVHSAPETAIFRSMDTYELTSLMRPFYVMVFFSFDLLARSYTAFTSTNYILHIVFVLLPVFWIIGILPPLDALFPWMFEQTLFIFFGGSPMASDLRLFVMLLMSSAVYLLVYFIPHGFQTVIIIAAFGYILSTDLGALCAQILQSCSKQINDTAHCNSGFLWRWSIREINFHFIMLAVAMGVAAGVYYFSVVTNTFDLTNYLGYTIIGLLVLEVVLADIQSVYVLFGIWRNKLYPKSVQRTKIFYKGQRYLNKLGIIRRALIDFFCPVVMVAYLAMSVDFTTVTVSSTSNSTNSALDMLGAVRAYRWVWQSTQNSLLEITVFHILKLALPAGISWHSLSLGVQLLIISFVRDRVSQILDKLYFYWTTLITAWSEKKQRRKSTAGTIALNLILFPVIFGIISVAAVLSAPLLPLFTLPVFLIGFPRPLRSWPEKVGSSASICPDSVYYKQAAPQLAKALRAGFASGSIGKPSPGKHYLLRFQDRMAWVQVLERGYGYCTISIKGLELQETSCHTAEASRVDDIIDYTYEQEEGVRCFSGNPYLFSTLRPYDAAYVKTFSDAKNRLTGVIDSPEVLQSIAASFKKTLIWVLIKYAHSYNQKNSLNISNSGSKYSHHHKEEEIQMDATKTKNEIDKPSDEVVPFKAPTSKDVEPKPVNPSSPTHGRKDSLKSLTNSLWSDDDSLLMESLGDKNKKKVILRGGVGTKPGASQESKFSGMKSVQPSFKPRHHQVLDDPDEDLSTDFGLPAVDISLQHKPGGLHPQFVGVNSANLKSKSLCASNISSSSFDMSFSKLLDIPARWHEIPVDLLKLNAEEKDFPEDWFKHVIGGLEFEETDEKGPVEVSMHIAHDKALTKMYSQFTGACNLIIHHLGLSGSDPVSLGANHVYKVYSGDIPWSPAADWMTADKELLKLVTKAYRYSVKLCMDEMLLGPVSSEEEMEESLTEYDRDWYIGLEAEPEWTQAIQAGLAQLMSLSHNTSQNTYHSRVLSCQDTAVYIGTLNPEVVRGQWANLNLELFYMTNDDEERYSIQAHPTLLRNLTVQAADPPLGYPIYSSPPISVPTL